MNKPKLRSSLWEEQRAWMIDRRTAKRRQTAAAVALSVGGHVALLVLIALDLDRGRAIPEMAPSLEITLAPLERTVDRPPPPSPPRDASPQPSRQVAASAPAPSPMAALAAPSAPLSAPPAPPVAELPSALRTGCIGKRGLEAEARVDCKLEIWSFLDGKSPRDLPGNAIPNDKEAAYALAAQRQAMQRRPAAQLGNGASMGCAQANYGVGCLDDMLLPLTGSRARANREGRPTSPRAE